MSATIQAFIFDMDGTLIDDMPFHTHIWVSYLTELGAPVDAHTFHERTAGFTNKEILRTYLGADLPDEAVDVYAREKEIRYRSTYRDAIQPIPGLVDFLRQARSAGIRLALATSAPRENIDFVLEIIGLVGYFEVIVGAEEVTRGKPDPEIFQIALRRLGLTAQQALVFEDSRGGIEAARRAGLPVIAITTGMPADRALTLPGVRRAAVDYTGLNAAALVKEIRA